MIYLKTKNFIILSFLFAIIAYFISNINEVNQFLQFLPSIFIVLMAITLFFISANSTSSSHSSTSYSRESSNSVHSVDEQGDIEYGTLYVGNLAYKADENDVQVFFESVGQVKSVRLVKDKRSGKRKGFGFVEITSGEEGKFIEKLNKAEFMQRNIIVRHANEKQH